MSAALTLAGPDHLDRLVPLVAAYHDEAGIKQSETARRAALQPLLDGIPHGSAYLIGPPKAPIGYIIITFGWSVEYGGLDGFVDEFFIRAGVRGRGIGTEVLLALPRALAAAGLRALHLEVDSENRASRQLYSRAGFQMRDRTHLATRRF